MSGRKSKIIAGTFLLLLVMCFMAFLYRNSTRGQFESSLPSEYSSDVTMREIKEDVDDFIAHENLFVRYDSAGYCDFLSEMSTTTEYTDELDETTLRYYKAYASYYLGNFGAEVPLDITIDGKETA